MIEAPSYHPTSTVSAIGAHRGLRIALVLGCVLSAGFAVWVADPVSSFRGEPTLATLLRGMAIIKGVAVLGAVAALFWRFARRMTAPIALSYCVSAWTMTATTVLIWQLTRIPLDAIAFHAALLTLLVTAWRDETPP